MQAAVYKTYGPPQVMQLVEQATPTLIPGVHDEYVLVKVYCSSINPFDYYHRQGFLPIRFFNGFLTPQQQILGIDVAGTVEAIGKNVARFKVGDRVFGGCMGSHAEYVRVREKGLTMLPANVTFAQAAAVPCAGQTALQGLRNVAHLKAGQKILINGAAGGIGHYAVQLAKYYGAEVTAVCSTPNLAWVKALGADYMIDYTQEDFTCNGKQYDVIYDAVGKRTFSDCQKSLTPTGMYITENPTKSAKQVWAWLMGMVIENPQMQGHLTKTNAEDLGFLGELLAQGQLKSVIEKTYSLAQLAEAHRHLEGNHTKGKLVIEVRQG